MPLICTSSATSRRWHPRSMRSSTRRTSRGNLVNEGARAPRSNLPLLILFLVTKRCIGKSSRNDIAFELPPVNALVRRPFHARVVCRPDFGAGRVFWDQLGCGALRVGREATEFTKQALARP